MNKYQIGTRIEVGKSYIRLGEYMLKSALSIAVLVPMIAIINQSMNGEEVDIITLSFLGNLSLGTYLFFIFGVASISYFAVRFKEAGVVILELAYKEEAARSKVNPADGKKRCR